MAIKFKLTKAEYDKLDDTLKGEYTLVGDSATLDLEGGPDAKAGDKFAAERDRRRAAEKRANDAESKITELEDKFGDVNTTIAQYDKKVAAAEKKAADAEAKYTGYVSTNVVDKVASDLAGKLSKTAPKLLLPHIKARLAADFTGESPTTVVLGADGKPSTVTLDALEKEFRDNKEFAAIITVSQASGGGASLRGTNNNGNAGFAGNNGNGGNQGPAPLATMNSRDLAARITERRAAQGREIVAAQGDRNGS